MRACFIALCTLATVAAVLAAPADSPSSGGCPGNYAEGAEVQRGRMMYVCQGGAIKPKGCIAESLAQITPGNKYDNGKYVRECKASGDTLTFEPSGCSFNGKEQAPGSSYQDANTAYTCKQTGGDPPMQTEVVGCVEGGKVVQIGQSVTKEDGSAYSCQKAESGNAKLDVSGCSKNGKQYKPGDKFDDGKLVFNCSQSGKPRAAGCVSDGKYLNDDETTEKNGVLMQCTVDKQGLSPIACLQNSIHRRLGCHFVDGEPPKQYEYECKYDQAANTAIKVALKCNYNVGNGVYVIDVGCYRKVGEGAIACTKEGEGLQYKEFQGADAEKQATGAGFHSC